MGIGMGTGNEGVMGAICRVFGLGIDWLGWLGGSYIWFWVVRARSD